MTIGTVVMVGIAVAIAVSVVLAVRGQGPSRVARVLRLVAAAGTVVIAAVVGWPVWQDSGTFALLLVGIPLLCAACALAVRLGGRAGAAVTWGAAVVMLGWSLVAGLGLGGYFLGPSVLMVAAAVAATPGTGRSESPGHTRARTAPPA